MRTARLTSPLPALRDPLGPVAGTRMGTLVFGLLVLVVAFHDLGSRSLYNLDIPRFGVLAREMVRTGEWLVPRRWGELYANKPPLQIWITALPAALTGEVTPFLVRLPGTLGLLGMVFATAAWGRLRTGKVAVGRAAALLLLGTFAVSRFGRESRPDMLGAGLATVHAMYLDRAALGRGGWGTRIAAGVFLGLALLSKGPPLLIVPVVVLLLPTSGQRIRDRLRAACPLSIVGISLLVAGAWFVPAWIHGGSEYARILLLDQATTRVSGAANHLQPIWHYATQLPIATIPWTPVYLAVLALVFWRRGRRALGPTFSLVVTAWIALGLFSLVPTKHVRYLLPILPLVALGAGAVLGTWLGRSASGPWRRVLALAAGLGVLTAIGGEAVAAGWGRAAVPFLVPGGLLLVLGLSEWRPGPITGEEARRRFVGALLIGLALVLLGYWTVRTRYRTRARDAFNHAVAEALPTGVPAYVLPPANVEYLFHSAPDAWPLDSASDLPGAEEAPEIIVLLHAAQREEAERARGTPARVLLEARSGDDDPFWLMLSFSSR